MEYKEQLLKLEAYREMLKQSLARNNGYYKNDDIVSMLKKIDLRYSVLSHSTISEDTLFDVEQWNQEAFALYTDICILYRTIIEYEKNEFYKLQTKVNNYTSSIQVLADRCVEINKMHSASTSIGDIVLYKDNNFDEDINNETAVVNLGKTIMPAGRSHLLYFINGTGFDASSTYCIIYNESGEIKRLSPYNESGDVLNIEDSYDLLSIKNSDVKYEYTLDSDSINNNIFIVPDIDVGDNIVNPMYFIGKNKITITNEYQQILVSDMINEKSYEVEANQKVRFYINDGLYFNISLSTLPARRNFTETRISKIDSLKVIEFTVDTYTQFRIDTDCDVYADAGKLKQNNNDYYVSNIINDVEDCLVTGKKIDDDISINKIDVVIPVSDINNFKIQSIALRVK